MSRPFVYEIPGPAEGRSGSRRRQSGVRLRRYLVTEVVTETESGERHEVRVERKPVSADEVDAVTASPRPAGKPVPAEGTDENDWFRAEGDPRR